MLKYIGNAVLAGIPARDLTDEEVEAFGEKFLLESGLYEKVRQPVREIPKAKLEIVEESEVEE